MSPKLLFFTQTFLCACRVCVQIYVCIGNHWRHSRLEKNENILQNYKRAFARQQNDKKNPIPYLFWSPRLMGRMCPSIQYIPSTSHHTANPKIICRVGIILHGVHLRLLVLSGQENPEIYGIPPRTPQEANPQNQIYENDKENRQ